jgi:UDP-N-acetylglucosamine acyltransferase
MLADGRPADVLDLNVRGVRRAGIPAVARAALKHAYKLLYRSNLNVSQALEAIEEEVEPTPEVAHLVEFIKQMGEGGFGRANDRPRRR